MVHRRVQWARQRYRGPVANVAAGPVSKAKSKGYVKPPPPPPPATAIPSRTPPPPPGPPSRQVWSGVVWHQVLKSPMPERRRILALSAIAPYASIRRIRFGDLHSGRPTIKRNISPNQFCQGLHITLRARAKWLRLLLSRPRSRARQATVLVLSSLPQVAKRIDL